MNLPHGVVRQIRALGLSFVSLVLFGAGTRAPAAPAAEEPPAGWWRDAIFYEIFVRSFADAAQGPLAHDGTGDLQGLIDHLDYLNDGRGAAGHSLGVNALWLMPIQPSPSYHGYDVTDYFAVNPQYGDIALMKRLVREAHQRGIRVIIDLVLNHCSSEHPLFLQATSGAHTPAATAARRMFRFADLPEELAGPWDQRVWHPSHGEFYYGLFTAEMPDWNFRDPAVTEHHRKTAAFWLREVGVDGFRLDAVRYFYEHDGDLQDTDETRRWLQEFTAYCHSVKPGAFVVGENTANMSEISEWIRGGSVDSSFEFNLAKATLEAIKLHTGGILAQSLGKLQALYGADSPWSTFLTNHDQERVISQLGGDTTEARFAAELLFTLPGVPFVYYAEELGEPGSKPDPDLRIPMPWTGELPNAGFTLPTVKPWHAVAAEIGRVNVKAEEADAHSMLALYQQLIRMNANSAALRHGRPLALTCPDDHAYAVMRETGNQTVLVFANFGSEPAPAPELTLPSSQIRATWRMDEVLGNGSLGPAPLDAKGGFAKWKPLAEMAPLSVHVVRWSAPAESK